MKGKFFSFEGIDGSGKTTVSKKIFNKMKTENKKIVLTQEPTKSYLGKMVDTIVEEKLDPITIALAFTADRNEHVKKIRKWLDEGMIVLCDRYIDSTYAYQAVQLDTKISNPLKWLQQIHKPFYLKPDVTFLFVLEPSVAISRIKRAYSTFEDIDFLTQVQNKYVKIASLDKRFMVLDATKNIDELVDSCIATIAAHI
jgi:dTMP kinase